MTRSEERRKVRRSVGLAILLSLLAHLIIIFPVAWFYIVEAMPVPEPPEDISVTFVIPPTISSKPIFVDSAAPESAKPENTAFESDHNTAAASAEKAEGSEPIPTQNGREQAALEMETTPLALAKPAEAPPAPERPSAPPTPPTPPEKRQPEKAEAPDETPPQPEGIGLLAKAEPLREPPKEKKPPPPALPPRPAFQRQARATRLRGSIDSAGRASVASQSTPLGRYRKAISDAVGSSWYYYIGSRLDMFNYGTVTVLFSIDKNGKAHHPRVLSNTSNESFEIVTVESILAAEIPSIPPDVLPALEGGQIEIDFSFSIITN